MCEGARGARALCERCLRQRPGERIRCLSCNRRVGPGCTPGCLLVETVRAGRQRTGLCVDWPHCGSSSPGAWTSVVRDILPARMEGWSAQHPPGQPDLERWTPAQLEALQHEDDDPAPPPPPGPPPPRDIDVESESESEAEVLLIRGPIGPTDCGGTSLLTDPFPGPIGRMPPPRTWGTRTCHCARRRRRSRVMAMERPGLARPARPRTDRARRGHGQTWRGAAMDRPGQQACLD